jgi:hypothetical protein
MNKPTREEEGEKIIGEEKEGYPVGGVVDAEDAVEVVSPERDAQPTLPARAEGPGPHLNRTHLPSKCRLWSKLHFSLLCGSGSYLFDFCGIWITRLLHV